MTTYDLSWRKSSHSNASTGDCVELAHLPGEVAVRDSKDPSGPVLTFTPSTLATFLTQAKAGRFDIC
jgi:hypothetical protein